MRVCTCARAHIHAHAHAHAHFFWQVHKHKKNDGGLAAELVPTGVFARMAFYMRRLFSRIFASSQGEQLSMHGKVRGRLARWSVGGVGQPGEA